MSNIKVFGHASYIGTGGINNHFRDFFRALSKYCDLNIRNFTVGGTWKGLNSNDPHGSEPYITELDKRLLKVQSLWGEGRRLFDYPLYEKNLEKYFDLNIISDIVDHHYFHQKYIGPKIAYTVWESTLLPPDFFNLLQTYDEVWAASSWQKQCMVSQGFDPSKIKTIPAGIDTKIFFPEDVSFEQYYSDNRFKFIVFGRWEQRKATKEIIKTFLKTFDKSEPVDLILSVDNVWADDGIKNTEERLKINGFNDPRLKVVNFPKREDYIKFLKKGHVFVSCSRGEGWNLPLIEAMACGTPSIYSNCSAQLDFAGGKGHPVNIAKEVPNTVKDSGNYYEPDWDHLSKVYRYVYENYEKCKASAIKESIEIRNKFDWDVVAKNAFGLIEEFDKKFNKRLNKHKKKLKVLYITPHLSTGGAPQYLLKKIELLRQEHDVYCVEYNQIATFYVVQRNKIVDMLGDRFISLQDRNKQDLLKIVEDINPDVIHIEEFPETFMDPSVALGVYKKDRKYLLFETSHGIYFDPNQKIYFPDKFLFVSEYQAEIYKNPDIPYEIVEYPIEEKDPSKEKYRKELNFEEEYKHVINVGLFTQGKNQGELVDYAKKLENEKIKFHFIGNQAENFSSYWGPIMKDIPKNCVIWGERNDVEKFYQAADLMVFTSKMETSPLVIREAISWKLPSLIYNLSAYKNMYSKNKIVKYLEPGNFSKNLNLIKKELNLP